VPAHVTLLFPFLPPDRLSPPILEALAARFAATAPFDFTLARADRFLEVIYLAPQPDQPFRDLVRSLWTDWPEHPPYGGAFAVNDILPHLTVAASADPLELDRIEAELQPGLPLECHAREAWLMAEGPDRWSLHSRFLFGAASTAERSDL
jgi:2'-5' RNA ligase